jgi:hypothetical protein
MNVKHNLEARQFNHCCSGQGKRIACSECVFVVLGIQHEICIRHIVVVVCPALQNFSSLLH